MRRHRRPPTEAPRTTPTEARPTASAVTLRGVSKSHGSGARRTWALREIDLTVDPGTFTAIMGPSGSGKTTLLSCLLGLVRPDSGSVSIGGTDITGLDETRLAELRRTRLGVVFQAYNLVPALTAADNISLPLRLGGQPIDAAAVAGLAEALGVGGVLGQRPAELSGGEQQRVALARALITRPDLVVADEPTGALDSSSAAAVLGLLRSVVTDMGQQVLMVTHDVTAAAAADRVLFLADGRWRGELRDPSPLQVADALATLGRPA